MCGEILSTPLDRQVTTSSSPGGSTSRYWCSDAVSMTASTRHFMYRPMPGFLILRRSKAIFILQLLLLQSRSGGQRVAGPRLYAVFDHGKHGVQHGVMHVLDHLHV